jgi:uncharacterized membrane protein
MKKMFILSEEELSEIIKSKVQSVVDTLTASIVRDIARKNNLNKMEFLKEENISSPWRASSAPSSCGCDDGYGCGGYYTCGRSGGGCGGTSNNGRC